MNSLLASLTLFLVVSNTCPVGCSCRREQHHCCISQTNICSKESVSEQIDESSDPVKCDSLVKSLIVEINGNLWPGNNSYGSCLNLRKLTILGNDDGLINYQNLELNSNDINHILRNMNSSYNKNLVSFSLTKTKFHSIQSGLLHRLKFLNIENIFINSNTFLSNLPTGCFLGLERIKVLDLQNNSLKEIALDNWGIGSQSEMTVINLSYNMISELKSDTFDNIRKIEEIYLDNNHLSSISAGIFNKLSNLKVLSLKGNNLVFSTLTGILSDPGPRILSLSNNPLLESHSDWWLAKGCPKKTEIINFDNIAIDFTKLLIDNSTRILDVSHCPSLREITLNDNLNLDCLPKGWFNNDQNLFVKIIPRSLEFCKSTASLMNDDNFEGLPSMSNNSQTFNSSLFGEKNGDRSDADSFGRSMILITMLSMFTIVVILTLLTSFITCYKRHKQQAILKNQPYYGNNENHFTYQHNNISSGNLVDIDARNAIFGINNCKTNTSSNINNTASYVYCPSIGGSQSMLNTLPKSPMLNGGLYLTTNSQYASTQYYKQNNFVKDQDCDSLNCNDSGISNSGKPSNNSSKHESTGTPQLSSPKFVPFKVVGSHPNYPNIYYQHQTCSPQRKIIDANLSASLISLTNPYRSQSPSTNSLMLSNKKHCEYFISTANSPAVQSTTTFNTTLGYRKVYPDDRIRYHQNYGNNLAYQKISHDENVMAISNVFANNEDNF